MRGTFANPRLRNAMAANHDGGFTTHHPSGDVVTIFEARSDTRGRAYLVVWPV